MKKKYIKSHRSFCVVLGTRDAYRTSRAQITLSSARTRLIFHGLGSANELDELGPGEPSAARARD